jgi:chorismate mutase
MTHAFSQPQPQPQELAQLMAEVDRLDEQLVALLSRRFDCSRAIGALKRRSGAAPFDPARVQAQQQSFVRLCGEAGLDRGMAQAVIGAIVDRVIVERGAGESHGLGPAAAA